MTNYFQHKHFVLRINCTIFLALSALVGCAPDSTSTDKISSPVAQEQRQEPALPTNWTKVIFTTDTVIDSKSNVDLDEFVAPIVRSGIQPASMHWYKPSFGNQNILWFSGPSDIVTKIANDMNNNAGSAAPPPTVETKEISVAEKKWQTTKIDYPQSDYEIIQASCMNKVIVYYWGDNSTRYQSEFEHVLKSLSKECK